jgi:hypothetical protein
MKADVPAATGTHIVAADIRRADPNTWRSFFVVGVNPAAEQEWRSGDPLFEMPEGTERLTGGKTHYKP